MLTIYKYALHWGHGVSDSMRLPIVKPLTVQNQQGYPQFWAIVDTELPEEQWSQVTIFCAGTGERLPQGNLIRQYLGTTQAGTYVWHWFAEIEPHIDKGAIHG